MTHNRNSNILPQREALLSPIEEVFDKVFNELVSSSGLQTMRSLGKSGYPKTDALISDNRYIIEMAVPGVNPPDLTVEIVPTVENTDFGIEASYDILKVTGKMERDYKFSKELRYFNKELKRSYFERSFILPDIISGDPEASVKNGMLTLIWELKSQETDEPKIRSIEVTSND